MIERRWSARQACNGTLEIHYSGRKDTGARIADIGLEGMRFVSTRPLPQNVKMVRLKFVLANGVEKRHEVRALIVHRARATYGVMFLDYDLALFRQTEEIAESSIKPDPMTAPT